MRPRWPDPSRSSGTSSNLLIAGIASDDGVHVSMLSFAPVALPVCLADWVLLLLVAPRLLRADTGGERRLQPWRAEVPIASGAIAIGRRAADIGIERTQEYVLQAIMRHGEQVPADLGVAQQRLGEAPLTFR
jgi:hypothetical protein